MGTEKDIFGKGLHYSMGKEDKPKLTCQREMIFIVLTIRIF